MTRFFEPDRLPAEPTIAIVVPRFDGKWVCCRHAERTGWEFPGGHREPGESMEETARRELFEETGATAAAMRAVSGFTFGSTCGVLFFAEADSLSPIPEGSEMAEMALFPLPPENCAYDNLPLFYDRVQNWLNLQTGADELWDVFDADRRPTGRLQRRGDPIPPGDFHTVVHIWVRRSDGRYLLTKRSPNKGFPNMWETTGGSALAGESSLTAALREVEEETGVILRPENGMLVVTRPWIDHFDDIWLFCQDFDESEIRLLEGETCDYRFAAPNEVLELHETGRFVPTDDLATLLKQLQNA